MRVQAVVVFALGLLSTPVWAVDYIVTRTDDPVIGAPALELCLPSGGCSLRQAVLAANRRAGADRIVLRKNTYALTQATQSSSVDGKTGPLWVTDALTVVGVSSALTRIRWTATHVPHAHQVFVTAVDIPLSLETLTVADGRGTYGGCIKAYGDLTITGVVIEGCRGERGGAAELSSIVFSMRNSTLRNNEVTGSGGALRMSGATTIIADGAQLIDNTALGNGGAIAGVGAFSVSPSAPAVWRNEGASSVFSGNSAGGNGGAISATGYFSMNLFVFPAGGPAIMFEDNVAAGSGGAVYVDPGSYPTIWNQLTLEGARLEGNAATAGGAIASRGELTIIGSAFTGNAAQGTTTATGRGGALLLDFASATRVGKTSIQQSSFNNNYSRGNGGAIASDCQMLNLRDVSLNANATYAGNGSAIAASGNTALMHVTTANHNVPGMQLQSTLAKVYHTACGSQPFVLANSLIAGADNCYAISAGSFSSSGGNQYGTQAGGCYILAGLDQWQPDSAVFGLSLGDFGGAQQVLGWNADGATRPQVGFGVGAYCSTSDIRGLPRNDGACDAGAFEQQPVGAGLAPARL
jgi:predicted outer membrane repeat protein